MSSDNIHNLVKITPSFVVSDICDPNPVIELISAVSNQPDDSKKGGDGHTTGDIIADPDGTIWLRVERLGKDGDRIYTLTWKASDGSGNFTTASAAVTVPHDKGKKK
jgi:hypothetical protein